MSHPYRKHTDQRETPQNVPLANQVKNSAGGHSFAVDDWARLRRFLIIGSEGGTYYIKESKLTRENAEAAERCLQQDGLRVVKEVVEISQAGRAPKNDPALLVLAMATASKDEKVKQAAIEAIPKVARIGTHLFHFAEFVEGFRGWGRALRRGVANWYLNMPIDKLALQVIKYKQRDGWSHRDLLRLSHPTVDSPERNAIFQYAIGNGVGEFTPELIKAEFSLSEDMSVQEVIKLIEEYQLPRECIPSNFLQKKEVWEALLEKMPMTAMIRNLGKMTSIGLLKPMSTASKKVISSLTNEENLRLSRIHPFSMLLALRTYSNGGGYRGSLNWDPVTRIVDALDSAFYLSFGNVEKIGKRIILALDVSGSMRVPLINSPISCSEGATAIALITAATEDQWELMAFSDRFVPINVSPRMRLDDVINKTNRMTFGRTDCALPMTWALKNNIEADAFVVYTDNETWYGRIHPVQALKKYRERMNIPARLAVVAMASNGFSIADPNDSGMLDVVGFDSATPNILSEFIGGNL